MKTKIANIDQNLFALKYLTALRNNEEALGRTENLEKIDDRSMFEIKHIELASTQMVALDNTDLGAFFQTLWPLTLTFRHALWSYWRTTHMYDYQLNLAGLCVLLDIFLGVTAEHAESQAKKWQTKCFI